MPPILGLVGLDASGVHAETRRVRIDDRSRRFEFDHIALKYDAVRLPVSGVVVDELMEQTHFETTASVLEVGAGTGQLTFGLRARGPGVTALEPGRRLRERLRAQLIDDGITVRADSFEEYRAPAGSYEGVVSANAFHWVDPGVAYGHAAFLTGPGRPLALIWTFPKLITCAADVAVALGSIDPELGSIDQLEKQITPRLQRGRNDLSASGYYQPPTWAWFSELVALTVADCVDLITTYAGATVVSEEKRQALIMAAAKALARPPTAEVSLTHRAYLQVAFTLS